MTIGYDYTTRFGDDEIILYNIKTDEIPRFFTKILTK